VTLSSDRDRQLLTTTLKEVNYAATKDVSPTPDLRQMSPFPHDRTRTWASSVVETSGGVRSRRRRRRGNRICHPSPQCLRGETLARPTATGCPPSKAWPRPRSLAPPACAITSRVLGASPSYNLIWPRIRLDDDEGGRRRRLVALLHAS